MLFRSLRGRHVLVTAGPTYEDIDPVRYVGNRSSGRMGFALAAEARRRGARVTLVAGPTPVEPPSVDELVRIRSAAEMHAAVTTAAPAADVVIMAAAVADYTPSDPAAAKMAKAEGSLTLRLQRTPDIPAELGRGQAGRGGRRPVLVGFAAETGDATAKGREKLVRKGVDLIVANDVSQPGVGFQHDTNAVTIVRRHGEPINVGLTDKREIAAAVLDAAVALLAPNR